MKLCLVNQDIDGDVSEDSLEGGAVRLGSFVLGSLGEERWAAFAWPAGDLSALSRLDYVAESNVLSIWVDAAGKAALRASAGVLPVCFFACQN